MCVVCVKLFFLCVEVPPPEFTYGNPPPPPQIRRPNLADFAELVCRIVGFLNLADLFCRITRFLGLCRLVLPTCWGFWVLGHLRLEASLTLGHCITPFLYTLVVQIGTMKCFYCPQKDVSSVPWDSLSSADQAFLRDKYPDAGEGAVCEFCIRSARPSAFFSRRSSGSSS